MITKTILSFFLFCIIKLEAADDKIEYIPAEHYYKLSDYSNKEINCFYKKQFYVEGACRTLFSTGPCASNEWLVLDKSNPKAKMRPKCSKRPCQLKDEVWWPKSNRCEKYANIKDCKEQYVIVNPYGEGDCGCFGWDVEGMWMVNGEFKNRNGCYKYYERGPCAEDEVVIQSIVNDYAICTKDTCLAENMASTNTSRKYAPILGYGRCVQLGDKDICKFVSNQSIYHIDPYQRIPSCSGRTKDWYDYKFPFMFRKDLKNDYNCAHWFDETINNRNCTCNEKKFLGCALPEIGVGGFNSDIGAKTNCILDKETNTCRTVSDLLGSSSCPKIFLNTFNKMTKRRGRPK